MGDDRIATWKSKIIQYFVPPVPLREGSYEAKEGERSHGSDENIELLLGAVISANQLSICGAVADPFNELSEDFRAPGKPAAPDDHLETMEIPTGSSAEETQTNAQQRGNLVQEYEWKFEQMSEDKKFPNYVLMRTWSLSKEDNTSILLKQKKCVENTRCLAMKRGLVWEDGFARIQELVQSWT